MVLLQIDSESSPIDPLKRNAPRAVDVNRISLRLAMEGVKIKPRLPQLVYRCSGMQCVQSDENAALQ